MAFRGRDPQIGTAGIEDDGKLLLGRPDFDHAEVLRVEVIGQRQVMVVSNPQKLLASNLGRRARLPHRYQVPVRPLFQPHTAGRSSSSIDRYQQYQEQEAPD